MAAHFTTASRIAKGIELVSGGRATARRHRSRPAWIEKSALQRAFVFRARELLLSLRPGDHSLAPWLEHHKGEQRSEDISRGRNDKHLVPASGRLLHVIGDRDQQGCGTFCRIEQSSIGGGEFHAEGVGA